MIPDVFALGGIVWTVNRAELSELGHCDVDNAVIRIKSGLSEQVANATFCHELVHAILFTMGKSEHDEREVDAMGNLLHQFFVTYQAPKRKARK